MVEQVQESKELAKEEMVDAEVVRDLASKHLEVWSKSVWELREEKMLAFASEVESSTWMKLERGVLEDVSDLPETRKTLFKDRVDVQNVEWQENFVSFVNVFLDAYQWVTKKYDSSLKKNTSTDKKAFERVQNSVCNLAREKWVIENMSLSRSFLDYYITTGDVFKEKDFKITDENRSLVQGFMSEYVKQNDVDDPQVCKLALQTLISKDNSDKVFESTKKSSKKRSVVKF